MTCAAPEVTDSFYMSTEILFARNYYAGFSRYRPLILVATCFTLKLAS